MRRPANPRSGFTRLMVAFLCIACTGAFAAVRGAVRPNPLSGPGWMAATQDQYLAPARSPTALALLREGQRADVRSEAERFGLGGPPHPAPRFLLAFSTVAPRLATRFSLAPPPPENRGPYDATAPPALP